MFGELLDGLSDFSVSATRDNTTFNNITLTDEGYQTGSSGIKVFSGSTPLTGTASITSSSKVENSWFFFN